MVKRKRVSGLDSVELTRAVEHVKAWRAVLDRDLDATNTEEGTDLDAIDTFIDLMQARLSATTIVSFSRADEAMLSKRDIVPGYGRLVSRSLPSDVLANKLRHAQDTAADHVMSSHNLVAKLNFLLRHSMSDMSEAHARLWIDSFLFRVTAMVANERRLLIGAEVSAASETLVVNPRHIETSGKIDHVRVLLLVDEEIADSVLSEEDLHGALRGAKPGTVHGLLVAEARGPSENLLAHLPQAIVEMQACARRLKSRHIRGTLTCGKAWCFLFLKLNDNLVGGTYWVSPRFDVGIVPTTLGPRLVDGESVVAIVARLYDWVMHAAEELDNVGWFVVR